MSIDGGEALSCVYRHNANANAIGNGHIKHFGRPRILLQITQSQIQIGLIFIRDGWKFGTIVWIIRKIPVAIKLTHGVD
ncbi:hypothetical protein CK621_09575 [Vandammella animalimorsus]|uniref:Uncharacterized protein n=1 Tax=Vandammella animalimorsus TaxID=2029117 RepID=A0A2A2AXC1_9BURK|nr:hypothetical protein CK621_09575 [Vandammella animalimorsus]